MNLVGWSRRGVVLFSERSLSSCSETYHPLRKFSYIHPIWLRYFRRYPRTCCFASRRVFHGLWVGHQSLSLFILGPKLSHSNVTCAGFRCSCTDFFWQSRLQFHISLVNHLLLILVAGDGLALHRQIQEPHRRLHFKLIHSPLSYLKHLEQAGSRRDVDSIADLYSTYRHYAKQGILPTFSCELSNYYCIYEPGTRLL